MKDSLRRHRAESENHATITGILTVNLGFLANFLIDYRNLVHL